MVFTKEINEIVLSSKDDERIQSTGSIGTYGTNKEIIHRKKMKCNNIMKQHKNDQLW